MKIKTLLLALTFGLFSITATAGGNHDHGHSHSNTLINQAAAESTATKIVAKFISEKKLDKSWSSIKASSVEKISFKGDNEWQIIFVNKAVTDAKKQKLYVFLTLGGDYIAANYTGS